MVTGYLQGKGFANVQWYKRAEPLPANVVPRQSTTYSDDWDEWVSGEYHGPIGSLSPPVALPWFIVHLPSYQAAQAASGAAVPSWVTSSQQAGAGALAAGQAALAASQGSAGALSSPPTAPAPTGSTSGKNAGAVVFAAGTAVLVFGVVRAILGTQRRKR